MPQYVLEITLGCPNEVDEWCNRVVLIDAISQHQAMATFMAEGLLHWGLPTMGSQYPVVSVRVHRAWDYDAYVEQERNKIRSIEESLAQWERRTGVTT